MPTILAVQSFRRGTGKSHLIANLGALLAARGRRVGLIDADFFSPSAHILLGVDEQELGATLNDYVAGKRTIESTIHDMTERLAIDGPGRLLLVSASPHANDIALVLREGYDAGLLNQGFHDLIARAALDVLLIDTHAGINEETMLSIAISDAVAILVRPDHQDSTGTRFTIEMARKLDIPRVVLIASQVPAQFDQESVVEQMREHYGCEVVAVIPHTEELMGLASAGIFALRYPSHPLTSALAALATRLLDPDSP